MSTVFNLAGITIGADPELFVARRGVIVSGHTLPLGTKAEPLKTTNGAVQVDGMAVEMNIPPTTEKVKFIQSCGYVLQDLEKLIKKSDPEMYLVCQPSARFTETYLAEVPESAKELGCNPDWDAYDMQQNPRPNAPAGLRTAGGHVHIGWGDGFNCDSLEHIGLCAEVAKQLDYCIGLPSLGWDLDNERRSLYGKAGAFRPKPYGMEYRVLSPMWLTSVTYLSVIWSGCFKALRMINEGDILDERFDGTARNLINNNTISWRTLYPDIEKAIR
jgi:hypothetical protein